MRLGQLARKLSVSPAEVTALLASKNIQTEEGTNTRLTDEQLTWILQHYGQEMSAVTLAEEAAKEEGTPVSPVDQSGALPHEPVPEVSLLPTEQAESQSVAAHSAASPPDAETTVEAGVIDANTTLIKAPKVELSGLKILGKIELPEPKKKEIPEKQEGAGEPTIVKREPPVQKGRHQQTRDDRGNGRKQQRTREGNHSRKNPIALQREREAREAEEKRQELARQEKERRTQYYQQRVKASVPTKPARLFNEPITDMKNERKQPPKSWFGRLLRWFKS